MKYLYPQLNARLERLAIVGAVLIITLVFLTACADDSDVGNDPHINGYCIDRTQDDGQTCSFCYGPRQADGSNPLTFRSCDETVCEPGKCPPLRCEFIPACGY